MKVFLVILIAGLLRPSSAQFTPSARPASIRGIVVNSVSHEPVSRALVFSPDNRFATFTDNEGRFEFTIPEKEAGQQAEDGSNGQNAGSVRIGLQAGPVRPNMLLARKPGFLQDPSGSAVNLQWNAADKEWTITLVPEALIVGKVTLANAEAPDSIQLELYRRIVQEGRARWVFTKGTATRADGEFRFADLPAATYKLLTRELLDHDPQSYGRPGQLYGYPPVYFPNALGLASASEITLSAGETAQANLSLSRQPYYNVRIPLTNAQPGMGLGVTVFVAGHRGPGYSLGFNGRDQAIEGMLPNGTYTVEATSYGPNGGGAAGAVNLSVHDSVASGSPLTLLMGSTIPVTVKEEFTNAQKSDSGPATSWTIGGRRVSLTGPRRYLSVTLEPEDDFRRGRGATLRAPTGPDDQSLVLEGVLPGQYRVRINTSRGYVAAIRSGNADLLHQSLTVGEGGAAAPIEITMRDETAEIEGTIEGLASPAMTGSSDGSDGGMERAVAYPAAHVYCVPLSDSAGAFTEVWVSPDGMFHSPPLAPGAYRVLAFARPHSDLEYQNPEAMQAYESSGPVVRLAAGQKESVRVQLITTE